MLMRILLGIGGLYYQNLGFSVICLNCINQFSMAKTALDSMSTKEILCNTLPSLLIEETKILSVGQVSATTFKLF